MWQRDGLTPGHWNGRLLRVGFMACGSGLGMPFIDEPTEMLHGLLVGCLAFLSSCLRGLTKYAGVRIARRPARDFHRTIAIQVRKAVWRLWVVE